MQVTIDIPDELAGQLIPAGQDPARALLEDAAIKAFVSSRISRSQLRSLLHFATRYELDGFLKQHGVGHGAYSPEDLARDIGTIEELRST